MLKKGIFEHLGKNAQNLKIFSDVFRLLGRLVYQFGHPNSGAKKNTFQVVFFELYFYKKYIQVLINDPPVYLIILKWLRR